MCGDAAITPSSESTTRRDVCFFFTVTRRRRRRRRPRYGISGCPVRRRTDLAPDSGRPSRAHVIILFHVHARTHARTTLTHARTGPPLSPVAGTGLRTVSFRSLDERLSINRLSPIGRRNGEKSAGEPVIFRPTKPSRWKRREGGWPREIQWNESFISIDICCSDKIIRVGQRTRDICSRRERNVKVHFYRAASLRGRELVEPTLGEDQGVWQPFQPVGSRHYRFYNSRVFLVGTIAMSTMSEQLG